MKIAILAADGYEDQELWYPRFRLLEEGYAVIVAAADTNNKISKYGYPTKVDQLTSDLNADDFDAVVIPGGIKGAESLRMDPQVTGFVKQMYEQKKPVASICHGAWVLISAIPIKGKKITCYKGMKDDLIVGGADYVDEKVVVDGNLITSRMPTDLPAFMKELLKQLISN